MNPLISIIVPVFNRAYCLEETLDSIATATYRPLELLLVDNNSTDNSLDLCQRWAETHGAEGLEVRVMSEKQQGANAARNRGLRDCKGEYVCFFDSDDKFCGDALTDVAKSAKKGTWDMAFLPVEQVEGDRSIVRAYRKSSKVSYQILSSMLSTQSMVFRSQWLLKTGGWEETLNIWQDWELGIRCLLQKPCIEWLCQRTYHRVLLHTDSITGSSFGQTLDGTIQAMRTAMKDIEDSKLKKKEKNRARRAMYLRAMIMAGKLRKEENMKGFETYRDLATEIIPNASKPLKMIGIMLSLYTATGGRGAWRVALGLV